MKKLILLLFIFLSSTVFSQIPPGYYDNATSTGYTLKTQLYNVIKGHTSISYNDLWAAYYYTDDRADGYVWDMYSNCDFIFGDDQDTGSGGTSECQVYNREHSFPRNWFGGEVSPMNSDLFHIYPTDKKVNNIRSNYPYGETNSPTYTSSNGSKLGPCTYQGYSGTVFEPIDEYKGDFARTYFYMATRYENVISSWPGSNMLDGSSDKCFTTWALNMLLDWNAQDPVSQKEIDRNDEIYNNYQHNRNPFIDEPGWVNCIWANDCSSVDIKALSQNSEIHIGPNPVNNILYIIGTSKFKNYKISSITGQKIIIKKNILKKMFNINLSNLPSGIYIIETEDIQGKIIVNKIIKK